MLWFAFGVVVRALMRVACSVLEPALLEETNRRAAWLSDRIPVGARVSIVCALAEEQSQQFVREWIASRLPWLRDEPLRYSLPTVSLDRQLPLQPNR